ncbi:glycosyltransferase family 4 protein [Patescibacteria group bacterium]|nr:glycosyltransferase family 4 protein [Patescibacteria group bacterium]MBP9710267.1 glycosyltransferase family 4 protein [Patescibacteria group bacterium]
MHIALDARMMGAGNTRGIGRYIQESIQAALEVDHDLRYTLVVRDLVGTPFAGHPRVDHVVADIPWYSIKEQVNMASVLEEIGADLIHVPHWNVSVRMRKPFVVTVHDVLLLRQPMSAKVSTKGFFIRTIKQMGFRLVLRRALAKAQKVFVPTEFVANEVVECVRVEKAKMTVTGEGVTRFPKVDSRLCSTTPHLLYVGSAYPHKRLDLLIRAWEKLQDKYPGSTLLVAGERDGFMERLVEHATRNTQHATPGSERVKFLGRVTDAELAGLYKGATAFVFPSSYEGFGLPPLESLSLGCPVIASDIACLREVLPKEGIVWFRDGDEHDIIRALEQVLDDPSRAKDLVASAAEWIRVRHDWRASAKRMVEGYRKMVERV